MKLKKDTIQQIFCVLMFLSAFIFIKPKVSFTNSGEITFYLVEIFGLITAAFLFFYIIKNYNTLLKQQRLLFWTTLVSQMAFVFIFIGRALLQGPELKSILIIESNLFVVGFFLLIVFRLLSAKVVMKTLSYFCAGLGIFSVISMFLFPVTYTDWVIFRIPSFYMLSFGNAIRTYLLLFSLPISALYYVRSEKRGAAISFYIHLSSTIICGMVSGARVNYLCIPVAIFVLALLLWRFSKNKKMTRPLITLGVSALSVVLVFVFSLFSMLVYTQLLRLDVTASVIDTLGIEYIGDKLGAGQFFDPEKGGFDKNDPNQSLEEHKNQAEHSAAESSSSRSHIWKLAIKDILSSPLTGVGLKQYNFQFSNGTTLPLQPHNFVIEYLLGFGLIGFVLWLVMMAAPEFLMLLKVKGKFWNSAPLCFCLCSLAFACAGALFQPYFIYPCVMFFLFTLMGTFYSISELE